MPRNHFANRNSSERNQIGNLTAAEKSELLDALWESIEAGALPQADTQRADLARRVAQNEHEPSDVIPCERVRADLFRK
jgi:putative addiction module component (TIGR02574 family)